MYLEDVWDPLTSNGDDIPLDETSPDSTNNPADGASVVVVVVVVVGVKMDPKNIPVAMPKGRAMRSSCLSSLSTLERFVLALKVSSIKEIDGLNN